VEVQNLPVALNNNTESYSWTDSSTVLIWIQGQSTNGNICRQQSCHHTGRNSFSYSDNGTNFQGAATQLHEIYTMLQSSPEMARVQDFLANEGCDWKFIPPHGLHSGGLWEAAVKSMKYHLRTTLGFHIATNEELPPYLLKLRPV
jgi:hypothetical protein